MRPQTSHQSSSWPRYDVDPNWVPLYRAPFVYRIRSGESLCELWDSIALGCELVSRLRHLGVHEAIIDPSRGEGKLILPDRANGPTTSTVRFHLMEVNLEEVPDERLREAVVEWVALMVSRLKDWLRRAVEQRCCVIVGRPISMLNGFIPIDPNMLPHLRFTNLREGEAVNAAGELLFCVRIAPLHSEPPTYDIHTRKPKPGSKEEQVCGYVKRVHPNGKPPGLSYHALQKELEEAGVHASEATVRQAVQNYLEWPKGKAKA